MSPKSITKEEVCELLGFLEEFKTKRKLTWEDISKDSGFHKRTIFRWKKNKTMSRAHSVLLEQFLSKRYGAFKAAMKWKKDSKLNEDGAGLNL